MDQEEILQKAIDQIGAYNRFGSKPGLERVEELTFRIGNPQDKLKVIHVAGTNGKGSVSRYLYSVLKESGYSCGLFTSPYLEAFTERIELDGKQISGEDLLRISSLVIREAENMVKDGLESPTEFEVVTAIALYYFAEKAVDFAVLEVGLGGRGDSTNVIKKSLVSIITSISLDHTDYLGTTVEQIAWEKAGIIKKNGIVVSSVDNFKAKQVIQGICKEKTAKFIDASSLSYTIHREDETGSVFSLMPQYSEIQISMMGRHQIKNALCALTAISCLQSSGIQMDAIGIQRGMRRAKQTGRIEILHKNPYLLIDGAHNTESAQALVDAVSGFLYGKKILIVCGILKDKEVERIVKLLSALGTDFITVDVDNPRTLPCESLSHVFTEIGIKGEIRCIKDSREAAETVFNEVLIQGNPKKYDGVLFTGSLYLIGKIRTYLNKRLSESK